jgi:hypothetical protein
MITDPVNTAGDDGIDKGATSSDAIVLEHSLAKSWNFEKNTNDGESFRSVRVVVSIEKGQRYAY